MECVNPEPSAPFTFMEAAPLGCHVSYVNMYQIPTFNSLHCDPVYFFNFHVDFVLYACRKLKMKARHMLAHPSPSGPFLRPCFLDRQLRDQARGLPSTCTGSVLRPTSGATCLLTPVCPGPQRSLTAELRTLLPMGNWVFWGCCLFGGRHGDGRAWGDRES